MQCFACASYVICLQVDTGQNLYWLCNKKNPTHFILKFTYWQDTPSLRKIQALLQLASGVGISDVTSQLNCHRNTVIGQWWCYLQILNSLVGWSWQCHNRKGTSFWQHIFSSSNLVQALLMSRVYVGSWLWVNASPIETLCWSSINVINFNCSGSISVAAGTVPSCLRYSLVMSHFIILPLLMKDFLYSDVEGNILFLTAGGSVIV